MLDAETYQVLRLKVIVAAREQFMRQGHISLRFH